MRRVLKCLDVNRLSASQRYERDDRRRKRYMKQLPGRRVQVKVIQADNGAKFQSAFHFHVLAKGFGHIYIKPRTPRLNSKIERSHRIDSEEFCRLLDGPSLRSWLIFAQIM
ncbi:hypothetical protein [Streptomyces iranensis]|uniref:hypothetical protein n=1 Tax=Streptomyces iranensis TaxID=576784 RepID=UPI0039B728E8